MLNIRMSRTPIEGEEEEEEEGEEEEEIRMLNIRMSRTPVEGSPVPKVELCSDRQEFGWLFTEERQSLGEIDRSRDRLGTLRHCDIHFINEQNSQELQISHSLRICLFTEGTVVPWVPGSCSCIHTHNQRNLYRLYPNSWRSNASCRRAAHRGCRALAPVFTHTISAIFTVGI
jgi:hypothetical protein